MSKKHIRRPQKYVKPKDPTFKEWWAAQSEKKQHMYKIIAIAVVVAILLGVVYYYGIYDDGSLKIRKGEVVGKQDNWLIAELDDGKNSDYYHIANVDTPEGYVRTDDNLAGIATGPDHHDTFFAFAPVDEASPIENIYVRAINKSVDSMTEDAYATFTGFAGDKGTISEITEIDTQHGKAKSFTYAYGYSNDELGETMRYTQSRVTYIPTDDKDVCVLISVIYYSDTEVYLENDVLEAEYEKAFAKLEIV